MSPFGSHQMNPTLTYPTLTYPTLTYPTLTSSNRVQGAAWTRH